MNSGRLHPKKFQNLLNLAPGDRANYFIREVANFEEVWTVTDNKGDFILITDKENEEDILLTWTHESFVDYCMFSEQRKQGGQPMRISLTTFIEKTLLDLDAESIDVGLFFDHQRSGLIMKPLILKNKIENELHEIWG